MPNERPNNNLVELPGGTSMEMRSETTPHDTDEAQETTPHRYNLQPNVQIEVEQAAGLLHELGIFINTDEELRAKCDAEQAILSAGREVLPLLVDQLETSDELDIGVFSLSKFVAELATHEDIDLLIKLVKHPKVTQYFDGSSMSNIAPTLARAILTTRNVDPNNPSLESIYDEISQVRNNPNVDSRYLGDLRKLMLCTGVPRAHALAETEYETTNSLRGCLDSYNDAQLLAGHQVVRKPHIIFSTWEEILQARGELGMFEEDDEVDSDNYYSNPDHMRDDEDDETDWLEDSEGNIVHRFGNPEKYGLIKLQKKLRENSFYRFAAEARRFDPDDESLPKEIRGLEENLVIQLRLEESTGSVGIGTGLFLLLQKIDTNSVEHVICRTSPRIASDLNHLGFKEVEDSNGYVIKKEGNDDTVLLLGNLKDIQHKLDVYEKEYLDI